MEEDQTQIEDWRNNIKELNPKLKIADGETKIFTFLDEGRNYKHPDFKLAVTFTVQVEGSEEKNTWFVNAEAYGLLNQIKALGTLTGVKVKLSRTGSKKSDTRYNIERC
jgi:hypothetical protein